MPQKYETFTITELKQMRERLAKMTVDIAEIEAEMIQGKIDSISVIWSNKDRQQLLKLLSFTPALRTALNLKLDQLLFGMPDLEATRIKKREVMRKLRAKQAKEQDKKP